MTTTANTDTPLALTAANDMVDLRAKSYGTIELKAGSWIIKTEPHVVLKLKRLFPRVSKQQSRHVTIKATDEISRDLLWFMQRFPMTVLHPREMRERAARQDQREQAWAALLAGKLEPMAFEMALPPRPYQQIAATAWVMCKGLLLADEMGLGKTCSTITALTDERLRPCVVVTLAHLPTQWREEIHRFAPKLMVHAVKSTTPYDVREAMNKSKRSREENQGRYLQQQWPDVLIISYSKLAGWAHTLTHVIQSIALDEVQEMRNPEAEKTKAAMLLRSGAEWAMGLSGTPIHNYGVEYFHIINLLRPGALGTIDEFRREWCSGKMLKAPNAFGAYLRDAGIMLRRTRKDVQRELPQCSKFVIHCDADAEVLREAEDAASELAKIILSESAGWQEKGQASMEIDWRLRQATGLAKSPYVAALVRLLVESGEKVVLYGWHRQVYAMWAELLKDLNPVFFTGSESATQKQASKEAFISGDAKVLIISLRSGAGLDGLQHACRTVVNGELDWSHSVHAQGETRVYRDGQRDPVNVYYPISDCGSDPFVAEVLGMKRGQLEGVIDHDSNTDTAVVQANTADGIRKLAERYASRTRKEVA